MEEVRISVLMPVYNGEAYLKEAIRSILDQTYASFELILVNDGSRDSSEKIIQGFVDPRIVYLKNETNLGLIASLNKAIDVARGNFLARMDADDIALPDRFTKQLEEFEKNPQLLVLGTDYYHLDKRRRKRVYSMLENDLLKANLLFSTCFCHPTVMIRRVADFNLRYEEDFRHAEDYRFWTVLAKAGEFKNLGLPLLLYRKNSSQVSQKYGEEQKRISQKIRRSYIEMLGLHLEEEDITNINAIGDQVKAKHQNELLSFEKSLHNLKRENVRLKIFAFEAFDSLLQKYWLDTCGNSLLGWKAFRLAVGSNMVKHLPLLLRIKLLGKCLLRYRFH